MVGGLGEGLGGQRRRPAAPGATSAGPGSVQGWHYLYLDSGNAFAHFPRPKIGVPGVEQLEKNLAKPLRQMQVTQSLLFLNKVLAVSRGDINDPETSMMLSRIGEVPPFVVYLIVKYLMKYGRANTPTYLEWRNFPEVLHHAFTLAIADPISGSSDLQVLGSLVRLTNQQLKRQITAQSYGLAIGLFQDLGPIAGPKPIDLRQEVEAALGMPIELFMRLGHAAHAAACATHGNARLHGTLNLDWLKKAAIDIPMVPWVERWADVARAIALDQKSFNAATPERNSDPYGAYRFNPLLRHPVIQVESDRFIAVDPWLLVDRTSWGVFYDIFEKYQDTSKFKAFSEAFGYAFERFVDTLLQSVVVTQGIWREATSNIVASRIAGGSGKNSHKVGDLAVPSTTTSVLIECTSKRPTRDLCEMAQPKKLEKTAEALAEELRQAFEHISAIQSGSWTQEGLQPGAWVALVVTFGRFHMINSVWFRKLIDKHFEGGIRYPYVVLSHAELDSVVRLVEQGNDFGTVVSRCASSDSVDPLAAFYLSELQRDAVSSFAKRNTERMYDFLPVTADEKPNVAE
jgi:hypothetical protein